MNGNIIGILENTPSSLNWDFSFKKILVTLIWIVTTTRIAKQLIIQALTTRLNTSRCVCNSRFSICNKENMGRQSSQRTTHMVPAIRVLMWVLSSSSSFANPKSDILAFMSLSSKTLLVLMSLCTIFNVDSSWRYAKPLAIPTHIFCLVDQFNFSLYVASRPADNQKKRSN